MMTFYNSFLMVSEIVFQGSRSLTVINVIYVYVHCSFWSELWVCCIHVCSWSEPYHLPHSKCGTHYPELLSWAQRGKVTGARVAYLNSIAVMRAENMGSYHCLNPTPL